MNEPNINGLDRDQALIQLTREETKMTELDLQPGMVVLARVSNPFENPNSLGKVRPVVLVERLDGHWRTMGLTTRRTYNNGQPRVSVPNPYSVGLHGPSQLWGRHLTAVYVLDVGRQIGWVDASLAQALADLAHLPYWLRRDLLEVAALHHGSVGAAAA